MSAESTKGKRTGAIAQRLRELPYDKRVCRLEDTGFLRPKRVDTDRSLEDDVYEIKVPPDIAAKARLAIERMLQLA